MKQPETQKKKNYLVSTLMTEDACYLLYHMLLSCVPSNVPKEHRSLYLRNMATFIDSLLAFEGFHRTLKAKTDYYYVIPHERGRTYCPFVFGRSEIVSEGVKMYISGSFSTKEGNIPRALEILEENDLIQIRRGNRFNKIAGGYRLSETVLAAIGAELYIKRGGTPRLLNLTDYVKFKEGLSARLDGKTLEELAYELPQSKRPIRVQLKRKSSYTNIDTRNDVGADGKKASVKYAEMYARQEAIPLDISGAEEYLNELVYKMTSAQLTDATKSTQTAIRSYYRRAQKFMEQGLNMPLAYSKAKSRNKKHKQIGKHLFRYASRYLSVMYSMKSILESGRSYYDRKTGLVYYKPEYYVAKQGGRSYELGGGFQNLSREVKERTAGGLVDNYDIIHCHLTIVQMLIKKHNLTDLCPLLVDVTDVATSLRDLFIAKARDFSFEYRYQPNLKKKQSSSTETIVKLSFTQFNRMFDDSNKIGGLVKILLYATLNNGSDKLAVGPKSKTGAQLVESALEESETFAYAKRFQRFMTECWNDFCVEHGIHAVFAALTDIYVERSAIYDNRLILQNEFGVSIRYRLKGTVKNTISRKDRKRVLNHIVTGHEVQMIYEFLTVNNLTVYCFEHDGVVLPHGTQLTSATINLYFKMKPFS